MHFNDDESQNHSYVRMNKNSALFTEDSNDILCVHICTLALSRNISCATSITINFTHILAMP